MSEDQKTIKKILASKITLFVLLLGFIWLSVQLVNVFYRKYKLNKEIVDLKAQISNSEKSNQQISAMFDYLGSPEFLEKEAREKLNMKRQGEEVVIVEPEKEQATTTGMSLDLNLPSAEQIFANGKKEDSNFMKWWKYFFRQ